MQLDDAGGLVGHGPGADLREVGAERAVVAGATYDQIQARSSDQRTSKVEGALVRADRCWRLIKDELMQLFGHLDAE